MALKEAMSSRGNFLKVKPLDSLDGSGKTAYATRANSRTSNVMAMVRKPIAQIEIYRIKIIKLKRALGLTMFS